MKDLSKLKIQAALNRIVYATTIDINPAIEDYFLTQPKTEENNAAHEFMKSDIKNLLKLANQLNLQLNKLN